MLTHFANDLLKFKLRFNGWYAAILTYGMPVYGCVDGRLVALFSFANTALLVSITLNIRIYLKVDFMCGPVCVLHILVLSM